jgi:hopanoid C-2 methylase
MKKDHNMMVPIMEAIKTMNSFGMEVVSGIILGLDTDKPETGQHLMNFIDESQIPLLTINLLQALPQTPLWDRLVRENRLIEDEGRESNVDFFLPYEDVVATWRQCMGSAYEPEKLIERYEYQIRETYPNRIQPPATPQRTAWKNIRLGLIMLRNITWHVGVLGDYKRVFWKFAFRRLIRGEIEHFISSILVAHHLINFARQASTGRTNASYYSLRLREASVPAE